MTKKKINVSLWNMNESEVAARMQDMIQKYIQKVENEDSAYNIDMRMRPVEHRMLVYITYDTKWYP